MTHLNLNGETDLPAGKVANIVTYLEMREAPAPAACADLPGVRLEPVESLSLERYRTLFQAIGEDWLWFSRVVMEDAKLTEILSDPKVEIYVLKKGDRDVGLLEFNLNEFPEIELAFFGLVPDMVGNGAGRWLMTRALEIAWAHKPERVWLHTCTMDSPAALPFYLRTGFKPFKRAVEVNDDPRLTGDLPMHAGPRVPVIGDPIE